MKEIKFTYIDGFKDVEPYINTEIERISPYLKNILRALLDLNWPETEEEELDQNNPEVHFTIPFKRVLVTGGVYNRVFELTLTADTNFEFYIEVGEVALETGDRLVGSARIKFSDWLDNDRG